MRHARVMHNHAICMNELHEHGNAHACSHQLQHFAPKELHLGCSCHTLRRDHSVLTVILTASPKNNNDPGGSRMAVLSSPANQFRARNLQLM